jgi:cysteinyl-tRNA synthetase
LHPDWKSLVLGQPEAALDRIIAAGFDGVYLDRADVHSLWRHEQPSAKADMIDLISEIASYARQKKPGFLVMMQNAEELLANERLRRALDGVAKEDLLYGVEGEGRENTANEVQSSLRYLRQARGDGLPVMVVEYLGDGALIEAARQRIAAEGFVAYFGPRSLNSLAQSH